MRKRKHKQPQYVTTKTHESFPSLKTESFSLACKKEQYRHILLSNTGMWGGFLDKYLCQKRWVWMVYAAREITDLLT